MHFRYTITSMILIFNPAAFCLRRVNTAKVKFNQPFTGKELARQTLLQNNLSRSSVIFTTSLIHSVKSWTKYSQVRAKPESHLTVPYTLLFGHASGTLPLHQARRFLLVPRPMLECIGWCFLVCNTSGTEETKLFNLRLWCLNTSVSPPAQTRGKK